MLIAGGALSSVYEFLLPQTAIDVVFHGEVETSLPLFIESANLGTSYKLVDGISYLEDGRIRKNHHAQILDDLDAISLPAYHLINIENYLTSKQALLDEYKDDLTYQGLYENIAAKLSNVNHFIDLVSSRGCLYRCSFCYRHTRGYRKQSVSYVIRHIEFLNKNFGISGFCFADELFNGDMAWAMEFCDAIESNELKIAYRINGARADRVSEKLLTRFYDTGCISINYGQESGSDMILKEYRKGVTKQAIGKNLLSKGWNKQQIDHIMKTIRK